ncbi:amidohydrolase family protein [Burkholderia cenocepacia]|uniref:Amidohydrolase family protein n=1 Tax=Burkholderia cenocepacia TaxID=95486 RepID=A0AAN0VPG1_9BURK|nr:amidohydrolase family protein [Burkholderia cenocepacia]
MRIVALEEHFLVPPLVHAHFDASSNPGYSPESDIVLGDLDVGRLSAMDEYGITQQVISASMPGADLLDGETGIRFAQATNNRLGEAVRRHPSRIGGFAHLPMREPVAAADELERAVRDLGFRGAMVNGLTDGRFLDDERFAPVLVKAVELDVPIYIHPNLPPKAVYDSYYQGLPDRTGPLLASGIFGWHSETAIHVFRLALAGTFDKFPGLTVIVGHMGEMLPFMLGRADDVLMSRGAKPISQKIVENVYITTSGVFHISPFLSALTAFGVDRIMFSVDYPYSGHAPARKFLDALPLSPIDRCKIAHGNADRLLKLDVPARL